MRSSSLAIAAVRSSGSLAAGKALRRGEQRPIPSPASPPAAPRDTTGAARPRDGFVAHRADLAEDFQSTAPVGETSLKRWQERQLTRVTIMPPACAGNRLAADPLEHLDLLLVVVRMAAGAVAGGVQQPLLVEGVLDAQVAVEAVDGVLGHVLGVHEGVVVDPRQVALAVVADQAAFAGHVALAADHVGVAVDAIDALLVGQLVGELDAAAQIVLLFRESGGSACRRPGPR